MSDLRVRVKNWLGWRGRGGHNDRLGLLVSFHWIAAFFSLVYSAVSWAIEFEVGAAIMAVNAMLLLANLAYLGVHAHFVWGANLFLWINCFVAVSGSTWYSGGLASPVVPWFGAVPVAATLLLGFNRNTFIWLLVALACVGGFGWAALVGWHAPVQFNTRYASLFSVTCLLGNGLLLFFLTQIFESVKNAALLESDQHNQELQDAIQRLNEIRTQMVQQEKLASLGALVAGVAHELNTPIGNALTTASSLKDASLSLQRSIEGGDLRKSVLLDFLKSNVDMNELIVRSCDRAATLISSFKQVAVDQTSEQRRPFELLPLVADNLNSLRPSFKNASVQFELNIPEGIQCDSYPGPLGQVIVNLLQNALTHAFLGRDQGLVRISAVLRSQWAEVVVADDGVGMEPQVLPRIFDPFFTTRLGHGGSGLGLSVSQNIMVAVLGGKIMATSKPGEGSRIILCFPLRAPLRSATQMPARPSTA